MAEACATLLFILDRPDYVVESLTPRDSAAADSAYCFDFASFGWLYVCGMKGWVINLLQAPIAPLSISAILYATCAAFQAFLWQSGLIFHLLFCDLFCDLLTSQLPTAAIAAPHITNLRNT